MPAVAQLERYEWINKDQALAMVKRMNAFMSSPVVADTIEAWGIVETANGFEGRAIWASPEQQTAHATAWGAYPHMADFEVIGSHMKEVHFELYGLEADLNACRATLLDEHPGCKCNHVVPEVKDYPNTKDANWK